MLLILFFQCFNTLLQSSISHQIVTKQHKHFSTLLFLLAHIDSVSLCLSSFIRLMFTFHTLLSMLLEIFTLNWRDKLSKNISTAAFVDNLVYLSLAWAQLEQPQGQTGSLHVTGVQSDRLSALFIKWRCGVPEVSYSDAKSKCSPRPATTQRLRCNVMKKSARDRRLKMNSLSNTSRPRPAEQISAQNNKEKSR